MKVNEGDSSIATGVARPIRTYFDFIIATSRKKEHERLQLLNQLEAVERATPFPRIDNGKTSLGSTQPIGPKDTP